MPKANSALGSRVCQDRARERVTEGRVKVGICVFARNSRALGRAASIHLGNPGRKSVVLALTLVILGFLSAGAWAGTIKLTGTYSSSQIDLAGINANGTVTAGTGPGGYGCKTSKGEVSCTADGKCTGTCQACGARLVGRGGRGIFADILKPLAGAKDRRAIRVKG